MYSSITVANYLLLKAWNEERDLTPMKILKLVYIAHGWYLGEHGRPLIRDRVRAWTYGPVIPELYSYVKNYGSGPITILIESAFKSVNEEEINEIDEKFLDTIWNHYKKYSAFQLSALTHQVGSPWDQAVTGHSRRELSRISVPIANSTIQEYYKNRIDTANGER